MTEIETQARNTLALHQSAGAERVVIYGTYNTLYGEPVNPDRDEAMIRAFMDLAPEFGIKVEHVPYKQSALDEQMELKTAAIINIDRLINEEEQTQELKQNEGLSLS